MRSTLLKGQFIRAALRFISVSNTPVPAVGGIPYPSPLPAILSEATLPDPDMRVFSGLKKINAAPRPAAVSQEISLAGRKVPLGLPQDWTLSFDDPEDAYALHRFGWVLPAIAENNTAAALFFAKLVPDWIYRVTPESHPFAWQTYNTAERIVHWIYLWKFLVDAGIEIPSESLVKQSLHRQASHVAGHLEYFGDEADDRTNNHLLNDGRALYMAGMFLRVPSLQEAGRKILLKECDRSITPNGFLREGSSHYHLLVLSRMLEVWMAAENAGDRDFSVKLKPLTGQLLFAARFFRDRPDTPLPLIGDVSPDFTPGWLRDIVFWNAAAEGSGWLGLWPTREKLAVPEAKGKGFQNFLDDGWCRFDGDDCRVFWHVQPNGRIPNYSHAHHDTGSFEWHLHNIPVFVDTGRANYTADAFGLYGRSARSHNACLVDGREPFVSDWLNGGRALLNSYKKARVESELGADGTSFSVRHDGFSRLSGVGMFERLFQIGEKEMAIVDRFEGKGRRRVDTYFHVAPGMDVRLDNGVVRLALPGRSERVTLSLESDSPSDVGVFRGEKDLEGAPLGWCSPQYGEILPAATIRFRQNAGFPLANRFIVRWS